MVLSISGLGSQLSLNLIDRTKDRQMETLRNEAQHQRAAESFRERISNISTPEEFVKDFEVYSFVMRAFDLEDQIFGKGMMRKILESNPDDDESLLNRLVNANFDEIHEAMGFTTGAGVQTPDFADTAWQDQIVDRYFDTVFRLENNVQNPTVGTVLELRDKVGEIDSWFDVLKDREIAEFFRTALALPSQMATLDVDKQVEIFSEKFDLSKLSDPEEVSRLETRYLAISDVLNPPQFQTNSIAVQLLSSSASGQFIPITIDIPSIQYASASLYR
ncbi:DUF1217 domain-containing protein [Cognatishimia sp. 1_MG-2023]|uniref:DUF1217 domain-containing protein n=1 Tax=Cognatishimia sp. 1_MG-2023 TaxID=3062642 RepID=UPI0026E35FE8|nr:DUF1217 domain-containing protein [Cognatishimia sp. 1_MG-2023]MDO6727892.1 DUF1217 domain-containing protein [Cognatishimia sp. 1_MG-2023]